ncbi:putative SLC26A/SulP transporter, STAS domain, STAS domain superfamily [Helianthus annuus]|nr:putative SLC26A/SulP transporter, STAS domain, STAS domain superfamily [Helianthus annuus]KAJ0673540.1 putative SLC26A/SulP transporter, STAS domain, STAS domain superfamily [Helianthus annuus]
MIPMGTVNSDDGGVAKVSFATPRTFATTFKSDLKETLFPDDPFHDFNGKTLPEKAKKSIKYFVPVFQWLPSYTRKLFMYDLLAGVTIASLAIPQGISYAKLANIPPVIGLYSSFVPPLIYAVFGNSKYLAVGTVASSSLIIAGAIEKRVHEADDPQLYLNLIFTATLISGVIQLILGVFRLGILVDFLSHSTITGFMGGTATIICLQQLKGIFGLKHFTTHTDVVSVIKAIFKYKHEIRWECTLVGVIFLIFLHLAKMVKQKKPKLFWVAAIAPMAVVAIGCIFAYAADAKKYGIAIVGPLKKGINPSSLKNLDFNPKYISAPIEAGVITAFVALAEGIAIGRSFALMANQQIDGNKEMIAFGLMNIVGSLTSCYLTTGPFSKTAVNYNAGCKTQMTNVVMAICMMLTLFFLAPLFSYTPLVALSAIIMSAMLGLIEYEKAYHLFKTDKFDFLICMAAFLGVAFISMDVGLMLSVGLALVRALLYVSRPASSKLGNIPDTGLYRDVEQYPGAISIPKTLVLQLGSPIYFANSSYIRERILRWVRDERASKDSQGDDVEYVLLDLGGVTSIDITGVETLFEIRRSLEVQEIKVVIVNPRLEVMEKLIVTNFVDKIGRDRIFLSIQDAIEGCKFSLEQ